MSKNTTLGTVFSGRKEGKKRNAGQMLFMKRNNEFLIVASLL